ncbi:restriction endonuclease subunit S [Mycoplasma seminis]|uniref:Restriction endonuclease subunit S n=1 Tax=Mycoplasma seminis TaxID=512749 RepID=A0ABY9HC62_9MOLU|nr:restriction endonuclease subunit S [Mycoplasma seminis]WLP85963.1 restriction endonuclease subunit S [Mycoplasma seminis]
MGNIFQITRGYVLPESSIKNTLTNVFKYPVFSSQTTNNGLMGYYNEWMYSDAITWTTDGANAGTVNYRKGLFYCTNVCGVLISKEVVANTCIAEILNRVSYKYVSKVGNPKLMNNVMEKIMIHIPNNDIEANKISKLFETTESLLTFYKRLSFWKPNKINIFFTKITITWEKSSFNNFYNFASEGGTPSTDNKQYYSNGKIPFIRVEDTQNKYIYDTLIHITEEGLSHSSAWLIPENSIILTNGATIGNVSINKCKTATKQGILGILLKENIDIEYMYYLLKTKYFQKQLTSKAATGTFASINLKTISNIDLLSTNSIKEQLKISFMLSNLDNIITFYK